jgi:hypothetical protein
VEEETNSSFRQLLPDHSGHQHQMVILNPDRIARSGCFHCGVCKPLIDTPVDLKLGPVEVSALWKVMKNGPDGGVGVAVVKAICLFRRDVHRQVSGFGQCSTCTVIQIASRVTNPQAVTGVMDWAEGGDQPAATPVKNRRTITVFTNGHRQAIRDEQQSSHSRLLFAFWDQANWPPDPGTNGLLSDSL